MNFRVPVLVLRKGPWRWTEQGNKGFTQKKVKQQNNIRLIIIKKVYDIKYNDNLYLIIFNYFILYVMMLYAQFLLNENNLL